MSTKELLYTIYTIQEVSTITCTAVSASMADLLSASKVGGLPTLHYIPDYITEAEEQRIMGEVQASQAKWVQLSGRRLQNHGGIVHTKGLIPAPMPRWLEQLALRVHQHLPLFGDQPPNHVLVNSYHPGCGIMPHEDGPLYHPVVCILSLGSPAVLRFWRKQPEGGTGGLPPVASVLAMPRSLLIFQDEAYCDCLHGIEEVTEETIDATVVNPAALEGQACAAGPAAGNNAASAAAAAAGQQALEAANSNNNGPTPCIMVPRQGERVSLTIRRVLKVHKALQGILKR